MIYTHPHVDHFGGCRGVLPDGAADVPGTRPEGLHGARRQRERPRRHRHGPPRRLHVRLDPPQGTPPPRSAADSD
ncbi:MBL fold metallo-hydrolase [Streptomyces hydrogenans]|uniref:MBL fold metallo-hydrolase n=1 Tax=Streptomyces hydrogenans TaxID=1873719 RepID=UPI001CFD2155